MRSDQSAFVGAVAGGLLVAAGWTLSARSGREAASPLHVEAPPTASESSPALTRTAGGSALELQPLATRLDRIEQRFAALEDKIDSLAAMATRTPASTTPVTAVVDADSLQRAMAEIERRKFEAMSDQSLQQMASQAQKGGDVAAGIRAQEMLMARAKSPEQRAKALMGLAMLQRQQGGKEDLAASVKTLQAVIGEHGADSKLGLAASADLVWTCSAQQDHAAGLRHAEAIVRSATATPDQRVHARWMAAIMVENLGDRARARAEFQALQRELEGQPKYAKLDADLRARLKKL